MEHSLKKDLEKMEKEWFDPEFPVLGFGAVALAILASFLIGYNFSWSEFTGWEMTQNIILLIGFAVYTGRQVVDFPFLYLFFSFKNRYQTLDDKKMITYHCTKHIVRTVFLVILAATLFFFHSDINVFWSIPVLCTFFVLPIIYRIIANKMKHRVEFEHKKNPVQRVSVDGKIDLTNLPFIFENLEEHPITNKKVKEKYLHVQNLLDYVTMRVSLIDDLEIVHTLKRMGEEELPRLLHEFETLESTLQEEYESKVLSYLSLLQQKLNSYKEMIDNKKTQNIQTTFSLLDERYKA